MNMIFKHLAIGMGVTISAMAIGLGCLGAKIKPATINLASIPIVTAPNSSLLNKLKSNSNHIDINNDHKQLYSDSFLFNHHLCSTTQRLNSKKPNINYRWSQLDELMNMTLAISGNYFNSKAIFTISYKKDIKSEDISQFFKQTIADVFSNKLYFHSPILNTPLAQISADSNSTPNPSPAWIAGAVFAVILTPILFVGAMTDLGWKLYKSKKNKSTSSK